MVMGEKMVVRFPNRHAFDFSSQAETLSREIAPKKTSTAVKKKSALWDHFVEMKGDFTKAWCKHCGEIVPRGKEGTPRRKCFNYRMQYHLRTEHKALMQEVAVKQAEVKASKTRAKADILAKAWTQAVKQEAPSPMVFAPLWGSFGTGGGPAFETPFGFWTTESKCAEAEGVWPEVEIKAEVGAWKEAPIPLPPALCKEEVVESSAQAETDHEMRIMNDRVYLIQTDGPGGLENTEVVITDLGEIGENAIVVFEEAVGVGAEEIVCGQDQEFVTFSDQENEILLENQAVFPDCDTLKIEQDFNGVHYEADEVTYESVEDVHLTDPNSVYFNVGLESESETSEVLSLPGSSEELLAEQPLNLVKKDRKRKPSSIEGNSDVVIWKLCNSYVVQAMIEVHNRDVHANMDRLVCPDCGKLFTSKRSL